MKYIILIIAFIMGASEVRAESYVTLEVNVAMELAANDDRWEGEVPFEFRATYINMISKKLYFTGGYSHLSNVLTGPPFNNNDESVLDRVFVGIGLRFDL